MQRLNSAIPKYEFRCSDLVAYIWVLKVSVVLGTAGKIQEVIGGRRPFTDCHAPKKQTFADFTERTSLNDRHIISA